MLGGTEPSYQLGLPRCYHINSNNIQNGPISICGENLQAKQRAPMGLQLIFRYFRAGNVNLEMLLSAPNNV